MAHLPNPSHASLFYCRIGPAMVFVSWWLAAWSGLSAAEPLEPRTAAAHFQQPPPGRPGSQVLVPCPTLEQLGHLPKQLVEVRLDIRFAAEQRLPPDCSVGLFTSGRPAADRSAIWEQAAVPWAASQLFHQPVYWDDPILERYGQSFPPIVQPWLSGAHFFGMFPIIPYKIGLDRTHDRIYTVGYYRPGSPTPCLGRRLPWEWDAALFESGAWLALILLLP